jgi:hypothetical protein
VSESFIERCGSLVDLGAGLYRVSSSLSHRTNHENHQLLICSISCELFLSLFVLSLEREIVSWMSIARRVQSSKSRPEKIFAGYGPRCGDEPAIDLVLPVWSAVNHFSFGTQLKLTFALLRSRQSENPVDNSNEEHSS